MFLDVGDNELYLEIAGQSDGPAFIFLHGGPGNIVAGLLPFQSNVGRQLEEDFLVVYLHQRGVGKSSLVSDSELTFDDYVDDLEHVVTFVSEKYGRERVSLVGHSWGGIYAVLYAEAHQEQLERLVLINTGMNERSMLRDSYAVTLEWARDEGIQEAIEALAGMDQSFETWPDALGQWASQAAGGIGRRFGIGEFLTLRILRPFQYPDWQERQSNIAAAMMQQILDLDLDGVASSLHVPALFVSGGLDTIVPTRTMQRDYRNYGGEKSFVLLEDSHHLPYVDEPDALTEAISRFLSD